MANFTPKYNLEMPVKTETYNIDVFNSNALKIDVILDELEQSISPSLIFKNKTVPIDIWIADTTYSSAGFGYRASILCTGITINHIPEVTFAPVDAISGLFAPVANSYDGGVYIYATKIPSDIITIPTIIFSLGKEQI